jgi:transcriptional regulator with XRE-family HTH domain
LELRELSLLSELVIRLLKDSCDVRGKLGGNVLGRPKSLLRVAQELDDDLNTRDDLLRAQTLTLRAHELATERLLPMAVLLELLESRRLELSRLSVVTLLPREGLLLPTRALQERWCIDRACHVRLLSVRRYWTNVHQHWTLRARRIAGKRTANLLVRRYARLAMNALQQLIRRRMDENNWSYGDIARRGGLPRSTVHNLATMEQLTRPPRPATLERLAQGLDIPLDTVRGAAATAAGLYVWHEPVADPEIEVMVAGLAKLNPQERRHVQALIRSLLNDRPQQD